MAAVWGFLVKRGTLTVRAAVAILGAGYSYVAGLPLAKDLLTYAPAPASRQAVRDWVRLQEDFSRWRDRNTDKGTEQYLQHLQSAQWGWEAILWPAAVRQVAAALATVPGTAIPGRPRYSSMVDRPYRCREHTDFWNVLLGQADVRGVVTTNYDLLAERSLRHRRIVRPNPRPGFHYGGFALPQQLEGSANPYRPPVPIVLEGGVPIYKIHGSLNWSLRDQLLMVYSDARPAFHLASDCAIVPPVPEKEVPSWLGAVWDAAEACLRDAQDWVVCGYSLPTYDLSVEEMMRRAGRGNCARILILNPDSRALQARWQSVVPTAQVMALSGFPTGTAELRSYF